MKWARDEMGTACHNKPMSLYPPTDRQGEAARMLLLRVAGQTLAVRQVEVAEILPLPRLSPLPEAPPILLGTFQLSREVVFVLPLAGLLGLAGAAEGVPLYHHLLLLPAAPGQPRLAILVDRVTDLVSAAQQPLSPAESFNGCVDAEIRVEAELVPVVALHRLMTAYEAARLQAFAVRQSLREAAFGSAGGG